MKSVLTPYIVREIAKVYDGSSETIDQLVRRFAQFGVKRHNVRAAAIAAGFKTTRHRVTWTMAMDARLMSDGGRTSVEDLATELGCTATAVKLRRKRIGAPSSRQVSDLTIHDVEHLTRIDHRFWLRFIKDGWLVCWERPRVNAGPVRYVTIEALHKLFTLHPEVFDYRNADEHVRRVLELDRLPDPPKFVRLTCQGDSWRPHMRMGGTNAPIHDEVAPTLRLASYSQASCKGEGGYDFWAPLYQKSVNCPRCGCQVSRFSAKAIFAETDPGQDEHLAMVAGKLGLSWVDGTLTSPDGEKVSDADLLRYVFDTKRNRDKAVRGFRGLLAAGLRIAPAIPVSEDRLLSNILSYELRGEQQEAGWQAFLVEGNIGIYWPPGEGKMFIGGMGLTRLAGEHVVFIHTKLVRDQWIEHLTRYAPKVVVRHLSKPLACTVVTVYDHDGAERCSISFWTYMTGRDFAGYRPVLAIFDEAHFLPGSSAHRLSLIASEYRMGLTATPFREDGRADLIQIMTGSAVGEDWSGSSAAAKIAKLQVKVLVVEDLEQKFALVPSLVNDERTIIFCDGIRDGKNLSHQLDIPFVYSGTSGDRMRIIRENRTVILSRVGDCGIDVPDLRRVVEFSFHKGARAQELQRVGRLLHSRVALEHIIVFTMYELERHAKRLTVLQDKGFPIAIEMAKPKKLPQKVHHLDDWLATVIAKARGVKKPTVAKGAPRYVARRVRAIEMDESVELDDALEAA